MKITELNAMQLAVLDSTKSTGDLVLASPTGSGKTLGFLLAVLQKLDSTIPKVQALIVVPSRELAIQIEQVFKKMGTEFKVNSSYGGHSTRTEHNNFVSPPALLVGTPGRIAFHLNNASFDSSQIHTLVLDEFDKSLEFGFKTDMSNIVSKLQSLNYRVLTSATPMQEIPEFVQINKPNFLDFTKNKSEEESQLQLRYLKANDTDKLQLLFELICSLGTKTSIIFCNHRDAVERIGILLGDEGIAHGIFHGGLEQDERERTLIKFRNGSYRILITTDLASRGLDIPEIEAVIHYQLPTSKDVFTHRNGRTARMHSSGAAYLLFSSEDVWPEFIDKNIEKGILPSKIELPPPAPWRTVYLSAGKKEKINKMDIVGLFLKKGGLFKEELGNIEVLDHSAFAAIKSSKFNLTLSNIRNEKIKNKKVKIEEAK